MIYSKSKLQNRLILGIRTLELKIILMKRLSVLNAWLIGFEAKVIKLSIFLSNKGVLEAPLDL